MSGADGLTDEKVLSREIPWETYATAKHISEKDLQLLRRFDKAGKDVQASLLGTDGAGVFEALLNMLKTVTKDDTVQYVLALLDDILTDDPARAQIFHQMAQKLEEGRAYAPIVKLLDRGNWYILEKTCKVLSSTRPNKSATWQSLVGSVDASAPSSSNGSAPPYTQQVVLTLIDWCCGQLRSGNGVTTAQLRHPSDPNRAVATAVSGLSLLLQEPSARIVFIHNGGLTLLVPILKPSNSPNTVQILYEAALCVWLLSFQQQAAEAMPKTGVLAALVDVARTVSKEKVLRVAALALRNMLEKADCSADAVDIGLPHVVRNMQQQAWGDEDLVTALEQLSEKLQEAVRELTSFERYRREVVSGTLTWKNSAHKDPNFWQENIANLAKEDYQVIRVLIKLLESSRDPVTLAIAAHDIGEFVNYHPDGRQIVVQDLKGKEPVLKLMTYNDPAVQKEALFATQKIMLRSKIVSA
eukprot:jgi/Chlat1/8202/Chrsp76S07633